MNTWNKASVIYLDGEWLWGSQDEVFTSAASVIFQLEMSGTESAQQMLYHEVFGLCLINCPLTTLGIPYQDLVI